MNQFTVIKSYRAAFENPIKVKTAEKVDLGKIDDEYPEWIWCTTVDGSSGWGPREYLKIDGNEGRFVCDYDATELTVDEGARVTSEREVAGWVWCRSPEGKQGWIPRSNLFQSESVPSELKLRPRKPWVAALLSLLMPGLGFAYAGYPIAANVVAATVILGVIGVQTLVVLGPSWIFRFYFIYIVGLSLQIINGVAAWLVAKRAKTSAPFRPTSGVRALVVGAVLLGGSAIVYPGYLLLSYKHFVVTSAAMEDCMLVGERFVVDMTAYRESSPRRGDVIVFVWPGDGVTQYVKRCIGVPGDTIEIRNKKVYINGQLEWNCLTCKHIDVDGRGNQIVRKEQVGIGSRDNMGIFIVSQERYFVLGDNRDNTSDSRFWGPVPRENILGKALRITSSDDPKRVGRFID